MTQVQTVETLEFAVLMAREFPAVPNLPRMLASLLKLSRRHGRLQERACNEQVPEDHDARCERLIRETCAEIGCGAIFSGDPRGCTVKLTVPSGRTNDWGAEGVCVPQ